MRFAREVWGYALTPEIILKWCNLVRFGVYLDQFLSLKMFLNHNFLYKLWCSLVFFGLYFERVLNIKWLLSYRHNDISYRDARGFGDMLPEKIFKWLMQSGAF